VGLVEIRKPISENFLKICPFEAALSRCVVCTVGLAPFGGSISPDAYLPLSQRARILPESLEDREKCFF
jgi:hypothetical protein